MNTAWRNDLQDASYRGVRFDVVNAQDSVSRDTSVHEYPFVDGGDVIDLGRKPRNFRFNALFWGDDYRTHLDNFVAALEEPGYGELVHPVWGSVEKAKCIEYQVKHEAEGVDTCTVELVFLEGTTGTVIAQSHPEQLGDSIFDKIGELTERAADLFEQVMAPVNEGLRYLEKGKAALSGMTNTITIMRGDISSAVSQGISYLTYPRAFISDMVAVTDIRTGGIGDLLDLKYGDVVNTSSGRSGSSPVSSAVPRVQTNGYLPDGAYAPSVAQNGVSATTLLSAWSDCVAVADELVSLPVQLVQGEREGAVPMPGNAQPDDVRDLTTAGYIIASGTLAAVVTQVLSDDVQPDNLSPDDIEMLVTTVREYAQKAIDEVRDHYGDRTQQLSTDSHPVGLLWHNVVSQLKSIALDVQDLGLLVITRRPPLTRRTVAAAANLHLLAHFWYGDYSRAAELYRLNPQIRDPNNLSAGDVINAYAK
ncbi:TPA: DNA circularization N-terminal domain-containing protein [Morganella morganii]|nr:DNA circularization N-terminal domain-containing protein [Morganella morganii]